MCKLSAKSRQCKRTLKEQHIFLLYDKNICFEQQK
jgi:hypothetical protein